MLSRTESRLSMVSFRLADAEASLHRDHRSVLGCLSPGLGIFWSLNPFLPLPQPRSIPSGIIRAALRPSPHRSPFTALALSAGSSGPRLLPAWAPMLPPVPRLLWLAQGGELGQGTQCGSLFPSSACWNWPISCLSLGALSKVNKQIQRSWGLGWRKGCWGFPTPGTPRAGPLLCELL